MEYGFFYLVNHGVDTDFVSKVFDQSGKFFSLPVQRKMDLARKEYRGYTPLYAETLDPTSLSKGILPFFLSFVLKEILKK